MEPMRFIFLAVIRLLLSNPTTGLQTYVQCMRNSEPLCCEEDCGRVPGNIKEEAVCDVKGNDMTCLLGEVNRNLPTPSKLRKITSAARCKIYKKEQHFSMSCHHDDKPICCEKPCEYELNLLDSTCTMTGKGMECSCAETGSGDNPVLKSCLHKAKSSSSDLMDGDTCYISTKPEIEGKGQQSKQENNTENGKNNECQTCLSAIVISLIVAFVIGVIVGGCVIWKCCLNQRCFKRGSCYEKQKKPDQKRKSSLEEKDKEEKTTDDQGQKGIQLEERPPQHKNLDHVHQRLSSTSSSD